MGYFKNANLDAARVQHHKTLRQNIIARFEGKYKKRGGLPTITWG